MKDKMKKTGADAKSMCRGSLLLGKFIGELVFGLSAIGVIYLAGMQVQELRGETGSVALLGGVATALMGLVVALAVGKYLVKKGQNYEH